MRTIILLIAIFVVSAPIFSDTLILQPGQEGIDTFVDEGFPISNYGNWGILIVGLDEWSYELIYEEHTLIQWDLSDLPPEGATIIEAIMELYCEGYHGYPSGHIHYYIIIDPWYESTVTWENRPRYSGAVHISTGWPDADSWLSANITQFVQKWYYGIYANYGIYILSSGTSGLHRAFFKSSDCVSYPDYRPRLTITYNPPDVVQPLSVGSIKALFN